jgi:hypothetical protein
MSTTTKRIVRRRELAPRHGCRAQCFIYRLDSGSYTVAVQIEGGEFASREDAEKFAGVWATKYSETAEDLADAG